jgi:HK97 gp10 family phage protein
MADDLVTVEVKGLDELQRALEELVDKDGTKYVRAAVRAGATVVRNEMAQQAPKETGFTSEHIDIKTKKQRGEALAVSALIGPNSKLIRPADQDRTKGKTAGLPRTASFIAKVLEFGRRGRKPFMTQAWESSKTKALDAIVAKLKEKLGL